MHNHSHCSAGGSAPATPAERRALLIALALNALMFGVELWQGMAAGSSSLIADALDFFSDAASYALTLFVIGLPLRVRARAAQAKAMMMILVAALAITQGLYRLHQGTLPDYDIMGIVALMALCANIVSATLLFRTRNRDSNMRSIWLCSRNDALNNILVMVAAALVYATGTLWPDLLIAALIAGIGIKSAFSILAQSRQELETGHTAEHPPGHSHTDSDSHGHSH